MRWLALFVLLLPLSCKKDETCVGSALFGRPNATTGLSDAQCQPRCSCAGKIFEAPVYGDAEISALATWTLVNPPQRLPEDPYLRFDAGLDAFAIRDEAVCAAITSTQTHEYELQTFDGESAARGAGAIPTHFGPCGQCSSFVDLAVYMRESDLTAPVRKCGVDNVGKTAAEHEACLAALGFTSPCAQIWYFNTVHTRNQCLVSCLTLLDAPYHEPNGALNECLRCDEEKSGPVFKAIAGRTRRNTGLANALCRPCAEVRPLVHHYE